MLPSFLLDRSRVTYTLLLTVTVASTFAVAASCAAGTKTSGFPGPDSGLLGDGGIPLFPETGLMLGDEKFVLPGTEAGTTSDGGCTACTDFPAMPLNDPTTGGTVSGDPTTLFPGDGGTGTTTGGPCLSEPANGSLYPYNWLRPRMLWASAAAQNVFEVRISAPGEVNDYVVYTMNNYWALDKPTWQKIAGIEGGAKGTLVGVPISVTVRATNTAGGTPTISNTAQFIIAPAIADGSLVYWTTASFATNATSTTLQGFHVGDEGTTTALTVPQAAANGSGVWAQPPDGGNLPQPPILEPVGCIGCHAATPDGNYVGFTAQWPWPNAIASIQTANPGAAPPWLTPGAIANLGPNTGDVNYLGGGYITATNNVDDVMLGIETFSPAHYATGDRIEVTSVGASLDAPDNSSGVQQPTQPACQGGTSPCVVSQLAWINLEWTGSGDAGMRPNAAAESPSNGGWGYLLRNGDTNSAGSPNWSNDGTTVAYTSVDQGTKDGRLDQPLAGTNADIKTIPYGFTGQDGRRNAGRAALRGRRRRGRHGQHHDLRSDLPLESERHGQQLDPRLGRVCHSAGHGHPAAAAAAAAAEVGARSATLYETSQRPGSRLHKGAPGSFMTDAATPTTRPETARARFPRGAVRTMEEYHARVSIRDRVPHRLDQGRARFLSWVRVPRR
jgi:hypothetical protein